MVDSSDPGRHRGKRRRFVPLIWVSGVAAAVVLTLGINGTLSSWTSAIITNSSNTVKSAQAVILQETSSGPNSATCQSSQGTGATNAYTCATIDKYGGTSTPLAPGASQSVTVTMSNVGTEPGALTLYASAGSCTTSGGVTTGALSLCDGAQVQVACPTGTQKYPVTGTSSLTTFGTATDPTQTTPGTPVSIATALAANASITCTFTVSLPTSASPLYANQTASQSLVWTLTGA